MRWRPAKGFLLDERNVPVHEFVLDPACAVTFAEASAAGALQAEGAAVRVGRYYAQTVRAGGIALLILANGPGEPESIEFLRQLLGAPARLADTARDRLELARTEEARLAAESRRLAAHAADVNARARGVAGLHEATAGAHGRITVEAAALATRSAALVTGEASVKERESELGRRDAELRDRGATIDAQIAKERSEFETFAARERDALEALRTKLTDRSNASDAQEKDLGERLKALDERARILAEQEAAVAARTTEWEGRAAAMHAQDADLTQRSDSASGREREIESRSADLVKLREQLDGLESREEEVHRRSEKLEAAESALASREDAVSEIQAGLDAREKELEKREAEAESFFEELSVKIAKNAKWEKALRTTAADLERQAKDLGVDADAIPKRDADAERKRAGKRA